MFGCWLRWLSFRRGSSLRLSVVCRHHSNEPRAALALFMDGTGKLSIVSSSSEDRTFKSSPRGVGSGAPAPIGTRVFEKVVLRFGLILSGGSQLTAWRAFRIQTGLRS